MSHTPGPWEYARMRLPAKAKDRRCGFVVNECDNSNPIPIRICDLRVPSGTGGFGEGEANARLIAAAPDLLAACQAVTAGRQSINCSEVWIDATAFAIVRAAIAKATGGAQ